MADDKNKMAENNKEVGAEQLEDVAGGVFFPDYMKTPYSDLKEKSRNSVEKKAPDAVNARGWRGGIW